jgi:hypothetical protein
MPKENKEMIRIQLVREGRVVKQITSRVHESVVLEQIKKYKDPFDTIQIVEGDLSEDAKGMLKHVAKKIVPAAMAAGMALAGHGTAQAQNRHPGTEHSIGQHMSDIFSPNYREIMRQRKEREETGRRVWDAREREMRQAEVDQARNAARREMGLPGQGMKVYDQARLSQDGRFLILYDMDNRITRVSAKDLEFMRGDSQRLPHYISGSGSAYYVRHPHTEMSESMTEGVGTIGTVGTVGTISSKGTTGNTPNMGNATSTQQKSATNADGTTNVKFDQNGQLELDDNEELSADSIATLKAAGVEVKESGYQMDPDLAKIIAANKDAVEHFKAGGELSQDLETDLHYHYYDRLSGKAQRDADDDGEIGQLFAEDLGIDLNESSDNQLDAILDQYADSFKEFKAGGDLTDNPEFYEALFDYYSNSGEMPYGVAKAREGDPVEWIGARLDREAGYDAVSEAEYDDEATPADQASADKNIIMQIRRQADYEKPQPMQLGDGSSITISGKTAIKILDKFDQLKPESKALMQQTLNDAEGFREMLNYFNEREIQTEAGPSTSQYSSLADAFPSGATEIWYWNDESGRDMMMGANWLSKNGGMPTPETLSNTHVQIGTLKETDPGKIFGMMQGENWSPNGEARNMIKSLGIGHTSMSVGDIIKVGSNYLMVDRFGFHNIKGQPAQESIQLSTHIKPVSEAEAMAKHFIKSVFGNNTK